MQVIPTVIWEAFNAPNTMLTTFKAKQNPIEVFMTIIHIIYIDLPIIYNIPLIESLIEFHEYTNLTTSHCPDNIKEFHRIQQKCPDPTKTKY